MRGSLFRRAGVVAGATVVVTGFAMPSSAAASTLPPPPCVSVSGSVYDAYGNPLSGATVTASGACQGAMSTATNAQGAYTVGIPPATAASGDPTTASLGGYTSATRSIAPAPTNPSANNFTLLYSLQAAVTPDALKSGATVSFTAATTAPPPDTSSNYVCEWGENEVGELGNGTTAPSSSPVGVLGIGGSGYLNGVTAVSTGAGHSLALLSNGTVVAWGDNSNGQLGTGSTTTSYSTTPVQVVGVGGSGTLSGVAAVAAGANFSMALLTNGTVVAWGFDWYGQLGNGSNQSSSAVPVQVLGVNGSGILSNVESIAAGPDNGLALLANGTVDAWGYNGDGELGNDTTSDSSTPVPVVGLGGSGYLSGVSAIADSGSYDGHSLALLSSSSTVAAWGYNGDGELGDGTTTNRSSPVQVSGIGGTGTLGGVVAVSAGLSESLAALTNGTAVAWGNNGSGQLGNGTQVSSSTPVAVSGAGGSGSLGGIVHVAAGNEISLASLTNSTIAAWGYNANGELGNGSTTNSSTPVTVHGAAGSGVLSGITAVAADWNSVAIRTDSCATKTSSTQVVVQLPDGSRLPLSQGATDGSGTTTWTGTYTVPTGTADGVYAPKVCAIDVTLSDTCDQAAIAGLPATVTPITSLAYTVDNTPPTFANEAPPANHDTTALEPTISATATDPASSSGPGSGVNASTESLTLDGTKITSGSLSYAPSSPLALGIHTVIAAATDNAGNTASTTWQFDVVSFSAPTGSASLYRPVPPETFGANSSQVTFPSVELSLGEIQGSLSSAMSQGSGTLTLQIPLNTFAVSFDFNGVDSKPVPVSVPAKALSIPYAVLASSAASLSVTQPTQVIDVGPVTVAVQAPYNVTGGTATLTMTSEATTLALAGLDPLPVPLSCSASANCKVTGTVSCALSSSSPAQLCGGTEPEAYLKLGSVSYLVGNDNPAQNLNGADSTAGTPLYDPVTPGDIYLGQPTCGTTETCANLLSGLGGANDPSQLGAWSVGGSLFSAFGHFRFYSIQGTKLSEPLVAGWGEANFHPGTAACVAGGSSAAISTLSSAANTLYPAVAGWALGPSALSSGAGNATTQTVVLSDRDNTGAQSYAVGGSVNLVTNSSGQLEGSFNSSFGQSPQPDGSMTTVTAAVTNTWGPSQAGQSAPDQEIFTGAEYSSSQSAPFGFGSQIFFSFNYDDTACLG